LLNGFKIPLLNEFNNQLGRPKVKEVIMEHDAFVREWCKAHQEGIGITELADRLGMGYGATYRIHDRLRKAGVELPWLFGQRPRVSPKVKKLNAIVHQMRGKK